MWSVWQTCRTGRRAAGFLGGLLVALLLAAGPAAGETFSTLVTLSNELDALAATSPLVAPGRSSTGQVQVYFAWKEGNDIYLKHALATAGSCGQGGNLAFDAGGPQRVSDFNPNFHNGIDSPAIAANDQGEVFVAWRVLPKSGSAFIQLSRSLDGGAPSLIAASLDFGAANPSFPAVAADGSGVLLAAQANGDVWLARPSSTSSTGFEYLNLTVNEAGSARQPSIAIASDGAKFHVVWRNGGVRHRKFDRSITQDQLNQLTLLSDSLTSASVQLPPKVAVYAGEVTAAWFEGANPQAPIPTQAPTDLKARRTTGGSFDLAASAEMIKSIPLPSPLRLANLSLSVGPAGRLFGWQEADFTKFTGSNHYLLKEPARAFESGSYPVSGVFYEATPGFPTAGPSAVQDADQRVLASWMENGTAATQIKLGYEGGSGGGDGIQADVRVTPQKVNRRTMDVPGEPNLTVFIQLPNGAEIVDSSVTMNGQSPVRGSTVVGDQNGDGYRDVMMKFSRSVLKFDETGFATVPTEKRKVKVKGNMSGGCFFGEYTVDIVQ